MEMTFTPMESSIKGERHNNLVHQFHFSHTRAHIAHTHLHENTLFPSVHETKNDFLESSLIEISKSTSFVGNSPWCISLETNYER